ncbi:MAG: cell division protein FtsW [Patescibacteria group bacterium]|nr:cell division protein FtsW [Patescibacteria group bacterium]
MFFNFTESLKEKIKYENIDKVIFFTSIILIVFGFLMFFSASIGFLNKAASEDYFANFVKMQMLSYLIGFVLMVFFYFFNLRILYKFSFWIFAFSLVTGFLIFVPGLAVSHGGGVRWVDIAGFSFQPADLIKFGSILGFAAYFARYKKYLDKPLYAAFFPILLALPIVIIFFIQKDLGTLAIIFFIVGVMYFLNKTRFVYIFVAFLLSIIMAAAYAYTNTYVMDRIHGLKEESYQTKQSLIALGSGGVYGRGYGQSVQKFFHLPEPAGDSIYAVIGEELGFFGTCFTALLFMVLILRSYKISGNIKNSFLKNLAYGIIILYFAQFVMNTGSMTKIIPLSGDTLPFFSKGGTAIIMNLLELGLLIKLTRKDIVNNNV